MACPNPLGRRGCHNTTCQLGVLRHNQLDWCAQHFLALHAGGMGICHFLLCAMPRKIPKQK